MASPVYLWLVRAVHDPTKPDKRKTLSLVFDSKDDAKAQALVIEATGRRAVIWKVVYQSEIQRRREDYRSLVESGLAE